jgi:hypothetical protein
MFSIADNYFPEIHRMLHAKDDPTPTERCKAAIDQAILVDDLAYNRIQDVVSSFFTDNWHVTGTINDLNTKAEACLHAHGCCKLSNDPGMSELAHLIVKGHLANEILTTGE